MCVYVCNFLFCCKFSTRVFLLYSNPVRPVDSDLLAYLRVFAMDQGEWWLTACFSDLLWEYVYILLSLIILWAAEHQLAHCLFNISDHIGVCYYRTLSTGREIPVYSSSNSHTILFVCHQGRYRPRLTIDMRESRVVRLSRFAWNVTCWTSRTLQIPAWMQKQYHSHVEVEPNVI